MRSATRTARQGASSDATIALLNWYDRHRRVLAWRAEPGAPADPYVVWLSEIMLQQTTVAAVTPYFNSFLRRWPNVTALAAAPLEAVLQQWAGLGYYSRARNLHACAKAISTEHGGVFPQTEAELRALPGIGPYTAAAIAAIAFNRRSVAVDGNITRVIARLYALEERLPALRARVKEKAAQLQSAERPGDFLQALMDLGATICTPRGPKCGVCPFGDDCLGRAAPENWPRKAAKRVRPQRRGAAFFLRRNGAVLLRTRPLNGLLGGMAELPGTSWTEDYDVERALHEAPFIADYEKLSVCVAHVFTHFTLALDIFVAEVTEDAPAGSRWVKEADLETEALPSVMRKVVAAVRSCGW
ncbi:MAG TPA: A/G-specific adenine glycosylase [Methylovirgula sp.]|nr:A/G-specific adenine glycosylase [Methylovirgula sp.]